MDILFIIVCYTIITVYILFKGGDHSVIMASVVGFFTLLANRSVRELKSKLGRKKKTEDDL